MRQLFLRIFLPVLLTVLLTFAVGMVIAFWVMPDPRTSPPGRPRGQDDGPRSPDGHDAWRGRMVELLHYQAWSVEDALRDRGPAAALDRVEEINAAGVASAYLLDAQGSDLCGRELPPELGQLAEAAANRDVEQLGGDGRSVALAASVGVSDDVQYVFVAEAIDRPPPERPPFARLMLLRLIPLAIGLGLVCYLLARHFASPILKLRGALRKFADGDLGQRVGGSIGRRSDEIGELARDFDHMAERIATLLNAQRRLLQDISHELRSPLARQRVAIELARQPGAETASAALDRVELEAGRLDELIGELLMLTRLESDAEGAERASVDLPALLREVIENAEFEACNNRRAVQLVECAPCRVTGVPELLRRAVENVVRNALAYTADDTVVEVQLTTDTSDALIRVRDHGPGVPDAELADIFRPFYRVSQARDRRTGGVGLGLTIAERAVGSHGGRVTAANHPGGGLLVDIRLPRETDGRAAEASQT